LRHQNASHSRNHRIIHYSHHKNKHLRNSPSIPLRNNQHTPPPTKYSNSNYYSSDRSPSPVWYYQPPVTSMVISHSFLQRQHSATGILPLTRIHDCTTNFKLEVDRELLALQFFLWFPNIITLSFLFPLAFSIEFHLFCLICFHIPCHLAYHTVHNVFNFL
jgi:hypothetical protein